MHYTVDQLCRGGIHRAIKNRKLEKDSLWGDADTPTITVGDLEYSRDNGDKLKPEDVEKLIRESRCVIIWVRLLWNDGQVGVNSIGWEHLTGPRQALKPGISE